jgi:hypothetical protein
VRLKYLWQKTYLKTFGAAFFLRAALALKKMIFGGGFKKMENVINDDSKIKFEQQELET